MGLQCSWAPANNPLNPIDSQRARWHKETSGGGLVLLSTDQPINAMNFTTYYSPTDPGAYQIWIDSKKGTAFSNYLLIRAVIDDYGNLSSVSVTPAAGGGSIPPPTGGSASLMP